MEAESFVIQKARDKIEQLDGLVPEEISQEEGKVDNINVVGRWTTKVTYPKQRSRYDVDKTEERVENKKKITAIR